MATEPRSFLDRLVRGRPYVLGFLLGALLGVKWFGTFESVQVAALAALAAVAWCATISQGRADCDAAAGRLVADLARYPDETVRLLLEIMEPDLAQPEREIHRAVLARLRETRPSLFDGPGPGYRYSDPEEGRRG